MLKHLARAVTRAWARPLAYDVAYIEHLLDVSPRAFFGFQSIMGPAQHREAASKSAYFAAKLLGALAEDCGPCVQLVVNMARRARMDDDEITAVVNGDLGRLGPETRLGFEFARATIDRSPNEDAAREAVRARWGDKAVVDLSFAVAFGRLFPMIKAGLGFAQSCQRITVGSKPINVAPIA